jgi:hypothetical protein
MQLLKFDPVRGGAVYESRVQLETTGSALREAGGDARWSAIGALDLQCRQAVDEPWWLVVMRLNCVCACRELVDLYRELVVCQSEQQRLKAGVGSDEPISSRERQRYISCLVSTAPRSMSLGIDLLLFPSILSMLSLPIVERNKHAIKLTANKR